MESDKAALTAKQAEIDAKQAEIDYFIDSPGAVEVSLVQYTDICVPSPPVEFMSQLNTILAGEDETIVAQLKLLVNDHETPVKAKKAGEAKAHWNPCGGNPCAHFCDF